MALSVGYLLIMGGICGCAPLFKGVSRAFSKLLSVVGFFVGAVCVLVAAEVALQLSYVSSLLSIPSTTQLDAVSSYLGYFLVVLVVLGILLFSRPIRNVRWASLIGLGVGLLVSVYVRMLLPTIGTLVLAIIFIIATLAVYTLLRFVEDLFDFVGTVLAFPPVAIAIGLAALFFGIVIAVNFQ